MSVPLHRHENNNHHRSHPCMNLPVFSAPGKEQGEYLEKKQSVLPIRFGFGYTGDVAVNLSGGLRRGITYLGLASLHATFDTRAAGLWSGGQVFTQISCTHGGMPSKTLTGDFQVASNIEAGNHLFIQELWYRQSFGKSDIVIGLQDLNATFSCNATGGSFLNSSFGIPSMITSNIPAPVFPLTTLGITANWQVTSRLTWSAALHDGSPLTFEENPYNLRWQPSGDHGVIIISRLKYLTGKERPGCFELGGYYHTGLTGTDETTGLLVKVFERNHGIYLFADKVLYDNHAARRIGMFLQAAVSPRTINMQYYYLGLGVNCSGLFSAAGADEAGIGVAQAGFHNGTRDSETTFEFFYRYQLSPCLYIQPDVQFIIHPAGTGQRPANATIFFLRAGFSFQQ
jgi:porin